jgi:hypothetical protein
MKILTVLFMLLIFSGCATTNFIHNINIGMTKEQVLSSCGSPITWNRQTINGKTYESLNYNPFLGNFDFIDNILVGYSRREAFEDMKYHSKDGVVDVRNYKNPTLAK